MSNIPKKLLEDFRGGWYRLEVQTSGNVQTMRGVLRDVRPKYFGKTIMARVWSLFTLDGPGRWADNGALVYMRPILLPAPSSTTYDPHRGHMLIEFRSKRGTTNAYTLNLYRQSQQPPWN